MNEQAIRKYAQQLEVDEDEAVAAWDESEAAFNERRSIKDLQAWQRANPEKAILVSRLLGEDTAARQQD